MNVRLPATEPFVLVAFEVQGGLINFGEDIPEGFAEMSAAVEHAEEQRRLFGVGFAIYNCIPVRHEASEPDLEA